MENWCSRARLAGATLAFCMAFATGAVGCGDDDDDNSTDAPVDAGMDSALAAGGAGASGGPGGGDTGGAGASGGGGEDTGGAGASGGGGDTAGAGGTDMDASQVGDGASGTGGGGTGGAGSGGAGSGGSGEVLCGDDDEVCTVPAGSTLEPCCTDDGACGGSLMGECTELEQPGDPDIACPLHAATVVLLGCCRPDGKCGLMSTLGFGCVERTQLATYAGGPLDEVECGPDGMDAGT